MKQKAWLSSKITLFLLLLIAAFLARQKLKQYSQNKRIEAEKQKILSQIEGLEKNNQELEESLKYFDTQSFKEKLAREQLSLKKPDEQVYSFTQALESSPLTEPQAEKTSNPEMWLKYFTNKISE